MASDPLRFLLLLPPAPSPPTTASLKAVFGETLSQVLKEVATHSSKSTKAAILEIALACPHLIDSRKTHRSSLYAQTQLLVAGLYKLICIVAAKEGIDVEDEDGVDVRILLLGWSSDHETNGSETEHYPYSIVGSLDSLARSGRPWQYAFGVESSDGEAMVTAFLKAKGSNEEVVRVQSGSDSESKPSGDIPQTASGSSVPADKASTHQKHYDVAVGGTFDHIHIGHKLLLTMTLFTVDEDETGGRKERSATIGITGDQLLKSKKHREVLESWEDRYRAVMTFVNAVIDFSPPSSFGQRHVSIRDDPGPNGKSMDVHYPSGLVVKCTEIQDAFGPTITEERISALVLSAETRAGGKAVNDTREAKGWKALETFEVDVLDAEEDGGEVREGFDSKLSSTAIREKLVKKRQSTL